MADIKNIIEGTHEVMLKAFHLGGDSSVGPQASKEEHDERNAVFDKSNAVEPPYPPEVLANLIEVSNSLRQNIDAYAVNIDGFGHRFEPALDLMQEDALMQVADAMIMERLHEDPEADLDSLEPKQQEVKKELSPYWGL